MTNETLKLLEAVNQHFQEKYGVEIDLEIRIHEDLGKPHNDRSKMQKLDDSLRSDAKITFSHELEEVNAESVILCLEGGTVILFYRREYGSDQSN